jgi:predicted ATPase
LCIDGLPCFSAATKAAAYRLVTLVDVAYERHVRLVFAAQEEPTELFRRMLTQTEYAQQQASLSEAELVDVVVDDTLGFVKHRTYSRIVEMSTLPYAREHARLHCPALLSSLPPASPIPLV